MFSSFIIFQFSQCYGSDPAKQHLCTWSNARRRKHKSRGEGCVICVLDAVYVNRIERVSPSLPKCLNRFSCPKFYLIIYLKMAEHATWRVKNTFLINRIQIKHVTGEVDGRGFSTKRMILLNVLITKRKKKSHLSPVLDVVFFNKCITMSYQQIYSVHMIRNCLTVIFFPVYPRYFIVPYFLV